MSEDNNQNQNRAKFRFDPESGALMIHSEGKEPLILSAIFPTKKQLEESGKTKLFLDSMNENNNYHGQSLFDT